MATELGAAKRYDPNTDTWVPIMIGAQGVGVPAGGRVSHRQLYPVERSVILREESQILWAH